jgi:hypothetical protein
MPEKDDLPAVLQAEMSTVLPYLFQRGWELFEFRYEPEVFGNWCIDLFHSRVTISLVKDRSQYSADCDQGILKLPCIEPTFDDPGKFQQAVIEWVEHLDTTVRDS